jgi:hypothetical protein
MSRFELGIFHKKEGRGNKLENFKADIYSGLDLERAGFLKMPKEVEERLIEEIAVTLANTSRELSKPLPTVSLIHGWDEPLPGYETNQEIREVIANATINEDFPNGVIRISPFFLKEEIAGRVNGLFSQEGDARYPLAYVLPHEDFHIWQFKNMPDQVYIDTETLKIEGLSKWNQTRTELDARQAANNWVLNGRY